MAEAPEKADDPNHALYWRANIKLLILLVSIWFVASFGLSILAVDWLDQFHFLGFPLGFWMAQQGSIIVFLVLIAVYALLMNRIDLKHGVEEAEPDSRDFEI